MDGLITLRNQCNPSIPGFYKIHTGNVMPTIPLVYIWYSTKNALIWNETGNVLKICSRNVLPVHWIYILYFKVHF